MSDQNWDRWDGSSNPENFTKGCSVFIRPDTADLTNGVRAAAPLPPDAAWVVTLDDYGSHAAVGVATSTAPLTATGYGFLFGASSPPDSWVLCFGREAGDSFLASSGGASRPILPIPARNRDDLTQIKLRLEAGRKLYAILPGGSPEQLLFDDLPQGMPLYAVAATVHGDSQVSIRRLRKADEDEESEKQAVRDAEALLKVQGNPHRSSNGDCRICTRCYSCTGWGAGCVKVFGKDRKGDAGEPCGCGGGRTGCEVCGICSKCAKECDKEHKAAVFAAAELLGKRPMPFALWGSCLGGERKRQATEEGDAAPNKRPKFPNPFDFPMEAPRCLLELQLLQLVGAIRDKPRWTEKVRDPEILSRWKSEAAAQGASEELVKYAFAQLEHEATQQDFGTEGGVNGVFTSDGLVPDDLRQALLQDVARLEALPPDWHPGSDQQVLDLVHPSLFCLVYGVTKQLPEDSVTLDNCFSLSGAGSHAQPPETTEDDSEVSVKTAWIPTCFDVDAAGAVRPLSYINNLHPVQFASLYGTLSRILALVRPLFERVLGRLLEPKEHLLNPNPYDWYEPFQAPSDPDEEDAACDEYYETRQPKLPTLPEAYEPAPPLAPFDLKGRRLQVIVKLANIVLTPDKPRYNGGSWHVEGMRNEKILATAIYYYAQENISDSHLAFRVSVDEPEYEQSDDRGVSTVFGLGNDSPLNQVLGRVTTLEGRCLCFPNLYQHQVQPFELKDKSKPGHRKILVFFLVDPDQYVLSTSEIPPQQAEWWKQEVSAQTGTTLSKMPAEVMDIVGDFAVGASGSDGCPFSLERAHAYRDELMQERKYFVTRQNESVFEREFSLCEH